MKINDLNPYPQAAPPVTGPAGTVFQDPAFGTSILRVTDENDAQSGNGFSPHYSAIYDFANTDSSMIFYSGGDGWRWIAEIDVAKKTVSNKRKLAHAGITYWSRVDPNVLYVIETWNCANLLRYDVKADTWTLVADFSKLLPAIAIPDTTWVDSRGMSWDDDRFHVAFNNALSIGVYSVKAGQFVGLVTRAQAQTKVPTIGQYGFIKSQMDASGRLLLTASQELFINVETGDMFAPQFGTATNVYGDVHPDFGSSGMGCGGLGGGDNTGFYPGIVKIDPVILSTYLTGRTRIGPRALWGVDVHASFRRKDQAWITITSDTPSGLVGADIGKVGIFGNDEVYQIAPDSPPDGSKNRRLFQHHSNSSMSGQYNYADASRACDSQDGRIVGFNSTYGNKRTDVYIAFLEEQAPTFTSDEIVKLKRIAGLFQ